MRLTLLLMLLISACATPEQKAERAISRFAPYCERLGYQPDTDKWRDCIQASVANNDANASRAGAAYIQTRPRTCQSNGFGGVTCY